MRRNHFLIVAVAGALMSSGCSTTPTAPASLGPPVACTERCEIPDRPPRADDQGARNAWEHETIRLFGLCAALHDDCAAESLKRLGDQ